MLAGLVFNIIFSMFKKRYHITSILLVFTLTIFTSACNKLKIEKAENLYDGTVFVIGHGGAGFQSFNNPLPHNSLKSIKTAIINQGADGVELDVQITKDGELILYHDNDLQSMTWCSGLVGSTESNNVLNCDYKTENLVNLYRNEKVISLKTALEFIKTRNIEPIIFLDLKVNTLFGLENTTLYKQKIVSRLVEISNEISFTRPLNILANDIELTQLLKEVLPQFRYWFGTQNIANDLNNALMLNCYGFVINNAFANKEAIEAAKSEGLYTAIFSMKSQTGILGAYRKNPEYLITDNINITRVVANR